MTKRTTLTLDDDVAAKLDAAARSSGRSFKETVNSFLRLGLNASQDRERSEPLRIEARDLGLRPGFDLDNIQELLDQLEGSSRS